jgi:hypothetical protein
MEPSAQQAKDVKPICIVIDTNIWRSELMLRTARGAALLFSLRQSNGVLGMPEVIEREIMKQAVEAASEFIEKIQTNFQMLWSLMGLRTAYDVPSVQEIEAQAKSRLEEMRSLFASIPFTLEHARSALDRVNSGRPPNGPKNQQFKDSAIWEAILELATTYRIYFLTNDRAFYKDPEKPSKGLADNLAAECQQIDGEIRLYRDISSCLEGLQKHAAPLDQNELANAIETKIVASSLEKAAADRGYSFTAERISGAVSAFPTGKIDTLVLTFQLTYRLADISQDETAPRLEPTLTAKGNCYYNITTKEISNVLMDSEVFRWKDAGGREFTNSNYYQYLSSTMGFVESMRISPTPREPIG